MSDSFRAFVVNKIEADFVAEVQELSLDDLPKGEVLVRVAYSSVNYKDGLATTPNGQIVRSYPFVPGIDLAGLVIESDDARFAPGDAVLATSYGIGVSHYGGYSEYARLPADWIVPLPENLSMSDAMRIGTAGFTAMLALHQMETNGLRLSDKPVLVTGATGGVGSFAVALLSHLGYAVTASTGKESEHDYLRGLGAKDIITRADVSAESNRPLEKERWSGVVDSVGGTTLAYALRTTGYGGSVAACGLTGGNSLSTSVFPFILRGVKLLGIDSVQCPMELRQTLWRRLAGMDIASALAAIGQKEIGLDELPEVTAAILRGEVRGRVLVKP